MNQNKRILLEEMYRELAEERKSFQDKINKNLDSIAEIDLYLQSIYDKEDSDFKVFSPRNVENVYREQIEKGKQEKYAIENENQYQYRQVNRIDRYLESLKVVLDDEDISEETQHTKSLYLKTLDIQEKDRQRIARDLHDTSLQNLAHLIHVIELSSMYIDEDPVRAKLELETVSKNLKTIIDDVRNTIFDLRPMSFDDLGINDAINDFLYKMKETHKIQIHTNIEKIRIKNPVILLSLYRVIKECCLNAMEHSKCTELRVDIWNESDGEFLKVVIADDGVGFDIENTLSTVQNHFGLKIAKERIELINGEFEITSSKGEGTRVTISVPIVEKGESNDEY